MDDFFDVLHGNNGDRNSRKKDVEISVFSWLPPKHEKASVNLPKVAGGVLSVTDGLNDVGDCLEVPIEVFQTEQGELKWLLCFLSAFSQSYCKLFGTP